ncbi:MAG: transposase [Ignavibacteria bacterium CG2_30_36_16]|nr:IS200/IS605 family transposase [Ignavibacteria bacterium]OIP60942.1 MAG: transposase [Ignavibacteria bacterium CG2_30_36_16]PJA99894.1 MAG: transposase [Ignavibacteria bacterium CG_4_9_14_3_um_filter_36_18]
MGNTYTQIHIQLIFAVQYRTAMIDNSWKDELYKYITGIIQTQKHKLMIINGVPNHFHILIGYRPHQALADLLQDIKGGSSKWINDKKLTRTKFKWQEGYGAFSYSHSHLDRVINYIKTQEEHHKKHTFVEEYKSFLKAYNVEYDERYILREPE